MQLATRGVLECLVLCSILALDMRVEGTDMTAVFLRAVCEDVLVHSRFCWPALTAPRGVFSKAERLARKFRCFGLDQRAHGESERGGLPLSPLVFSEDLLGVVRDRGWQGEPQK